MLELPLQHSDMTKESSFTGRFYYSSLIIDAGITSVVIAYMLFHVSRTINAIQHRRMFVFLLRCCKMQVVFFLM